MKITRRGFTIVELVIVIAVIAILAAVLIPTFSSLTEKANASADEQLLRNMNIALAADEAEHGKPADLEEVIDALARHGIDGNDPDMITPKSKGYVFAWDPAENRMHLVSADALPDGFLALAPPPPEIQPEEPVAYCTHLLYEPDPSDAGYYVTGSSGCECSFLYIPSTYNEKPVIGVGDLAFRGNGFVTALQLEEGLTSIGKEAFRVCSNLKTVSLPDTLTTIGDYAFSESSRVTLTKPSLPTSLKKIGEYAFRRCFSLDVTLPAGITQIGAEAFSGTGIKNLNLSDVTRIQLGNGAFSSCKIRSLTLPNTPRLAEGVFQYCTDLEEVRIEEGRTGIPSFTFNLCDKLARVYLPHSTKALPAHCLSNCESLAEIHYNGTKEEWLAIDIDPLWLTCYSTSTDTTGDFTVYCTDGEITRDGALPDRDALFPDNPCTHLSYGIHVASQTLSVVGVTSDCTCTYIRTPVEKDDRPVTSVFPEAFKNNPYLTAFRMDGEVESIDQESFANCTALTRVALPASLVFIRSSAFEGCASLSQIYFGGTKAEWSRIIKYEGWDKGLPDYTVYCTDGAITVDDTYGCSHMILVQEGDCYYLNGLTEDCTCTELVIPSYAEDGLPIVKVGDFIKSEYLTKVVFNRSLRAVCDKAFTFCPNLETIEIFSDLSDGVSYDAFDGCSKLETLFFDGFKEELWKIFNSTFSFTGTPNFTVIFLGGSSATKEELFPSF